MEPISGWEDLRRRLYPNRRVHACFHPTMPAEPLVILHAALQDGVASTVSEILDENVHGVPLEVKSLGAACMMTYPSDRVHVTDTAHGTSSPLNRHGASCLSASQELAGTGKAASARQSGCCPEQTTPDSSGPRVQAPRLRLRRRRTRPRQRCSTRCPPHRRASPGWTSAISSSRRSITASSV